MKNKDAFLKWRRGTQVYNLNPDLAEKRDVTCEYCYHAANRAWEKCEEYYESRRCLSCINWDEENNWNTVVFPAHCLPPFWFSFSLVV